MTVVLNDRRDITVATLERVAFGGEQVRFSSQAHKAMARMHDGFQRYCQANQDRFIYRVTSGAGPDAKKRYSLAESRERRRRRKGMPSPAFGGDLLPESVTRAALFAALAVFVEGHATIPPARADTIAKRLDGPLPRMPARGLLAAGELMPNALLFSEPYVFDGDGFATGHGAQTSAAMAAVAAILGRRRAELAERVFALSLAAFGVPADSLERFIWSGAESRTGRQEHPGHQGLSQHLTETLRALARWADGTENGHRRTPNNVPSSLAVIPAALAHCRQSIATLNDVAERSLRTVGCNPVYLPPQPGHPEGRVLSVGGYHNAQAAPAIDALAVSWVNLAALAHRQIINLHRGAISGLPDRLVDPSQHAATPYAGYSTAPLEWVPNDFVAEMRKLAEPTLLTAEVTASSPQDDVAITAPLAFRTEMEVGKLLDAVLAVLAVTGSQALYVTGDRVPPNLQGLVRRLREVFPPVQSHRQLGEECRLVATMFSAAVQEPDGILC
jgi:histidine ammonia-lyase